MYSVKAILKATRVGLRSKTYQRTIATSLLERLKDAIRNGDDEEAYAYAAGITAVNALKDQAQKG